MKHFFFSPQEVRPGIHSKGAELILGGAGTLPKCTGQRVQAFLGLKMEQMRVDFLGVL